MLAPAITDMNKQAQEPSQWLFLRGTGENWSTETSLQFQPPFSRFTGWTSCEKRNPPRTTKNKGRKSPSCRSQEAREASHHAHPVLALPQASAQGHRHIQSIRLACPAAVLYIIATLKNNMRGCKTKASSIPEKSFIPESIMIRSFFIILHLKKTESWLPQNDRAEGRC